MQLDIWIPEYNLALEYQGRRGREREGGEGRRMKTKAVERR
jgi:hypothetical protein